MSGKNSLLLEILDEQDHLTVDDKKIRTVCETILSDFRIRKGKINVVLVDNETIQQYNRDFLRHDYPTDVISFSMECDPTGGYLEGEILVCTEIAGSRAAEFGWTAEEELLLYVIHGMLHLAGFDDTTPELRSEMNEHEQKYLAVLGITAPKWNWDDWDDDDNNDDNNDGNDKNNDAGNDEQPDTEMDTNKDTD